MLSDIGTTLTIHKEQSILGMINEDTPYKLAEIIRDTWPNLYRPPAKKHFMEITAYTTEGCFYCEQLKELFRRANLEYTSVVVKKDITRQEFKHKFPEVDSFPHVVIDGTEVGGLTQTAKLLLEKGLVSSKKNG